jgi:hypothetical protein
MAQIKEQYRSSMNTGKILNTGATVTCLPNVPTKLGEYKVQAGEMIALGYGEQSGLDNAVGRFFADIRDNAVAPGGALNGVLRLSVFSPQDRPLQILAEYDTDIVNDNPTDRTKQTPFPFNKTFLSEDKKLVLEFISSAGASVVVSQANSKILFDVTQAIV